MSLFEIFLIVFCSVFVLGVIVKSIIDKKNGKSSCGCNCANCKSNCSYKK
ncbi:MAG: FeoB-associated Cys-rich membrane protein [Clostridia bacterium]|nr:FeoB-associated Cys-rich membrane protein [Clostridia bacterium]